ncbi:hypothetical protein ACPA9J_00390 [Pseudomonas aeruginosa]
MVNPSRNVLVKNRLTVPKPAGEGCLAGGSPLHGERMTVAKNDAEEGVETKQFADQKLPDWIWSPPGSWLPVGDSLSSLSIWLIRKRFPVPQDNFVPVAISSSRLVPGQINTVEAEGASARHRESRRFRAPD